DPFFTAHVDKLSISKGILNRECVVTPSGKRVAAMPDDATTNEIPPVLLTFEIMQLYKNVFPVPPWPCKKNSCPFLFCKAVIIDVYA
ncbi:hypothetical protein LINPERHAP2_LOCUS32669, partial [Linum perenne]